MKWAGSRIELLEDILLNVLADVNFYLSLQRLSGKSLKALLYDNK